jgi:hypothetical protein
LFSACPLFEEKNDSDPVVKNKLQFRGLNLVQKLDDHLEKLIGIIEYTTFRRCLDMAEKPEVGRCQLKTLASKRSIICVRKYSVLKCPADGMASYRRHEIRQFPKSLST